MRIDGTTAIQLTPAAGEGNAPAGKSGKSGKSGKGDTSHGAGRDTAEISAAAGKYIARVTAGDEVDTAAVAEARRLIEAGLLDTADAAGRAADVINSQGV
ncbi:MAG: hypothetical protein J7M14_00675 [Planctomycetes bacterium]|nr:hypothetical protein [Planctomycetota bacterium]